MTLALIIGGIILGGLAGAAIAAFLILAALSRSIGRGLGW